MTILHRGIIMKIKKLTTNQLKKLREYLFTKRLSATNKEEWQKYADMSDEVKHELSIRRGLNV